jgi:hypothetical protein
MQGKFCAVAVTHFLVDPSPEAVEDGGKHVRLGGNKAGLFPFSLVARGDDDDSTDYFAMATGRDKDRGGDMDRDVDVEKAFSHACAIGDFAKVRSMVATVAPQDMVDMICKSDASKLVFVARVNIFIRLMLPVRQLAILTPLMYVCMYVYVCVCMYTLAGVDGWQPIHEAVRNGHEELVCYLVENGAGGKCAFTYLHCCNMQRAGCMKVKCTEHNTQII